MNTVPTTRRSIKRGQLNDSSKGSERPLYLYIVLLGNLIAVAGMAFLLLGVLGALGLITAITDSLGGFGSSFASATTGSAIEYSFAFLASLLSLAASWKMFREGPALWLLALVVVFQLATAGVFHSWVSVILLIPAVAALYGLVRALQSRAVVPSQAPASAASAQMSPVPAAPAHRPSPAADLPAQPTPARAEAAATASVVPTPPIPTPVTATPVTPMPVAPMPVPETLVLPVKDAAPVEGRPGPTAPSPPSRTCADCGAENPQSARFCGSCGSILPG